MAFREVTEELARAGFAPPEGLVRRDMTIAEVLELLLPYPRAPVAVRMDVSEAAIDTCVGGVWHALSVTDGTADDVVKAIRAREKN